MRVFLKKLAEETIQGCCFTKQVQYCGNTGEQKVFLPAGDEKYKSFWPVDAIFSSRCALMDSEMLKDIIDIIFTHGQNGSESRSLENGLQIPPYAIADHINFDGQPVYFPGTYRSGENQGDGSFGFYPPLNNLYLVAELVDRYISQSGDREILEKAYHGVALKQCLKNAFYADYGLDENTQLCRGDEDRYVVDWSYCDQVKKSGLFLVPSVMRAEAAEILADYFPEERERFLWVREQIITNLVKELFDETTGWFWSATQRCHQRDVWGTVYAIYSGLLPETVRNKACDAVCAAYRKGIATAGGCVRHILTTEDYAADSIWERVDSPYNTYMNGGYWATPSGWFAYALYLRQPELAEQFVKEYMTFVKDNKENGAPYEWFHPVTGKMSGLRYGTSGTAVYAAMQKMHL